MAQGGLNFVLLGDIMLGRYVDDHFELAGRKSAAFGDVLPLIRQMDPNTTIVAGNLECAVTSHPVPTPKAFNFKLSPSHADVLCELQLSYVSLANNHVLDYGQQGLQETHKVLDGLGIAHSGSGTLPEAAAPAFVNKGGHKVAFLSYSDHYDDWAAGSNTPGINYINPASYKVSQVQQQVGAARAAGADLVCVFIHWGPNWRWQPDGHQVDLGRTFLDAGADLVFGHSAHHVQGVQFLGRKAIVYGAGGFIDDYATDEVYRNDLGCIWLASFGSSSSSSSTATTTAAAAAAPGPGSQACFPGSQAVRDSGPDKGPEGRPGQPDVQQGSRDQQQAVASSSIGSAAAAGPAAAAAATGDVRGKLQLMSLKAVPIHIHHDWRKGLLHGKPGEGDPPYVSQVDLAHGLNYRWVADKLEQLCSEWHTHLLRLPDEQGLMLLGGEDCHC